MSWATPRVFARCTGCGAEFDGTRAEIAREVGVCGCGRESVAGTAAGTVRQPKAHAAVRDYEPAELFGGAL